MNAHNTRTHINERIIVSGGKDFISLYIVPTGGKPTELGAVVVNSRLQ